LAIEFKRHPDPLLQLSFRREHFGINENVSAVRAPLHDHRAATRPLDQILMDSRIDSAQSDPSFDSDLTHVRPDAQRPS
jgi:hypothetical protein